VTEHLTRRRLEEMVGGATAPEGAAALAHLAVCEACASRKRVLESSRALFLQQHPADQFARAVLARGQRPDPGERGFVGRARLRTIAIGSGLAAVAAMAAALWLLAPAPSSFAPAALDGRTIRFKGGAALEVHVKRGERVFPLHDGDALAPGDQLGFVYTLAQPGYVVVFGIDDTGAITRYFPAAGAGAAHLAAAGRAQLPVGIELDQHRGTERIVALFSDRQIDDASARGALTAAFERARRSERDLSAMPRVELVVDQASVWFRKP
jgi:hypothetical protein